MGTVSLLSRMGRREVRGRRGGLESGAHYAQFYRRGNRRRQVKSSAQLHAADPYGGNALPEQYV